MVNLWRNEQTSRIHVHESDDYLGRKDKIPEIQGTPPGKARVLVPFVVGLMVACISQSIAQLMRQIAPDWHHNLFLFAPILTALAGYATFHTIQKRFLSGSDSLRYQIFELVIIFLICKISTHLDQTLPEILANIRSWFSDPKTFFDGETILLFLVSGLSWFASTATARDFYTITDPTLYIGEKSPVQRISTRFFAGGLIIMITTAFSRVSFMDLLQTNRPRVPGLIFNLLVYYALGLFMLGQLKYRHHLGLWQRQKVHIHPNVKAGWLRYSLLFLAVVMLVAFLLPTGYTIGLLDLVQYIIHIIIFLANLIIFLLSYPFLLLLSLIFPNEENVMPVAETPTPIQPPQISGPQSSSQWLEMLKSLVFWVLALVALGYVIRGYLRDRPNLLASLKKIRPVKWVISLLRIFTKWWDLFKKTAKETMPKIIARLKRAAITRGISPRRQRGSALRNRVFYHYLSTLDVASEQGFSRLKTQTPYEYSGKLEQKLTESQDNMSRLTEVFVQARYSKHPIDAETVDQVALDATAVQDTLRNKSRKVDGFENS